MDYYLLIVFIVLLFIPRVLDMRNRKLRDSVELIKNVLDYIREYINYILIGDSQKLPITL